ncbi:hypothetical protein RS030_81400 [Cryptosporidium xiaoi]|uniref:ER membrane protein complex subunit 7 beta-sandwich domain-containing protein n=1 Tax=Cryptosporidium xiaoi TaxID=659607 RepID=A0AAV9XTI6_9CRYT
MINRGIKHIIICTLINIFCLYKVKCEGNLTINGKIEAPSFSFENTRIFISGRPSQIRPNSDGFFKITNLPVGNYLLRIIDLDFVYNTYEIQVFEQATNGRNTLLYKKFVFDILSGIPGERISGNDLHIKPLYSTKEENKSELLSSVLSLLKNPLVVITLISLCITYALPMLQDSLDAEAMEEITGSIPGGKLKI